MCGIGAIINLERNDIREIVKSLATGLEERGKDATGFCFIDGNHYSIFKKPKTASEIIYDEKFNKFLNENSRSHIVMVHCRKATRGDPSNNKNNHPIESERYIVIHNGVITDNIELTLNRLRKWDNEIETDTYTINKVAEYFGVEAVPSITGSIATIIYDKFDKKIYVFRNKASPLFIGYYVDAGLLLFASTKDAIIDAVSRTKKLFGLIKVKEKIDYKVYIQEFEEGKMMVTSIENIDFKEVEKKPTRSTLLSDDFDDVNILDTNEGKFIFHFIDDIDTKLSDAFAKENIFIDDDIVLADKETAIKMSEIIKKNMKRKRDWTRYYGIY